MKKNILALFDLDETLFSRDTEGEWINFMDNNNLIKDLNFLKKKQEFDKSYKVGNFNIKAYLEFVISPVKGMRKRDVDDYVKVFTADVVSRLTDNLTKELLETHKDDTKIITSGALSFLVKSIGECLGIDATFGSDPELEDGIFTGKISGTPNFSYEKVRRIKAWKGQKVYSETYAYSDSIHDLPLLEYADFATVVSPDERLRSIAEERNWPIDNRRISYS